MEFTQHQRDHERGDDKLFSNPWMFAGYGQQSGEGLIIFNNELYDNKDGFMQLSEEEVRQLELLKEWTGHFIGGIIWFRLAADFVAQKNERNVISQVNLCFWTGRTPDFHFLTNRRGAPSSDIGPVATLFVFRELF